MSDPENKSNFSSAFSKILKLRGLEDQEQIRSFLYAGLSDLKDPFLMKGMREAVTRIQKAISSREKILIHGDYDADGITATTVLARTLSGLHADFTTFLPERNRDGYGVSAEAIQDAKKKGISFLITVDCGITAHEEITLARNFGMDVLIIDHHRIPSLGIPTGCIVLNPLQTDCAYPCQDLTAAGLVFKLSQVLISAGAFNYLDLVALSTVSDVAPLVGENRIFVKHGLKQLGQTQNIGLKALAGVAGIWGKTMNVGHLGFVMGPRINACGRMSSPDIALRLLMTNHEKEAESLAKVLDEENKLRQKEERTILKEAMAEVERTVNFNRDRMIVIGRDGWHQGIVGIVASRLVERYYRPSIVIGFQDEKGKGSGRSVRGFHLYKALESCGDLLEEFGGHELAAGVTIGKNRFSEFRKKINQYAAETYAPDIFVRQVKADMEIKLADLTSIFVNELKLLEPHGVGNPRPIFFTRGLEIKIKPVQRTPQMLQFWVSDGGVTLEANCSSLVAEGLPKLEKGMKLDLYFSAKSRMWQGIESLSLEVKNLSLCPGQ